jgi:DNA repair ATPase RecN
MTVEGGFLDGLDLSFTPGLNVLIGGRGTGKTSVIELIRFCLGVPNYTDDSAKRSLEHALAILEDGQVRVTLTTGENRVVVSRSATPDNAQKPRFLSPIIFSQTDIESLGLQAAGRLRLIDSFRTRRLDGNLEDNQLIASVQSLTVEMQELTREIENFETQLSVKATLEGQLKEIAAQEQELAAQSKTAKSWQVELQNINQQLSSLGVSSDIYARTTALLRTFAGKVDSLMTVPPTIERWPKEAGGTDKLADIRSGLDVAIGNIERAGGQIRSLVKQIDSISASVNQERIPLENKARDLRKTIEQLQQGAGAVSRTASQIREKLTQLKALASLKSEKLERLAGIQRTRGQLLDQLDAIWERRFKERLSVAERINSNLNPRTRISPVRSAQLTQYVSAISAALRGSGLRYSELSVAIAGSMSPRELIEIVELGDAEKLGGLLGTTADRAVRLITRLRDHGMADILTAHVEDDMQLELLDGTEYKDIESLSTGQRCTVILPIIMEHKDRALVVDQPEDHLDNAFVVETLVKAILNRGATSQLILSTHNANIPVLGNAAQVVVMGSDGRRGFISHKGDLEDETTVEAITNIMEGGAAAFERRAQFYKQHLTTDG